MPFYISIKIINLYIENTCLIPVGRLALAKAMTAFFALGLIISI